VIGYAGALDPDLRLGDLVAVRKALAFSLNEDNPVWENARLDGSYELTQGEELTRAAESLALRAIAGDVLTSSYVLGEPAHKKILFDKFRACIVDMETAALAGVAASRAVPISCVRVISDEAADDFLAPFSHDPSTNVAARAGKLFSNGMVQTYRDWRSHTQIANRSLARFLSGYL
jgi:nucleoside phosphorylase